MPTVTDSFDRANGALASPWVGMGGTPTILSGAVTGSNFYYALHSGLGDPGRMEASCNVLKDVGQSYQSGVVLKGKTGTQEGFYLTMSLVSGVWKLRLGSGVTTWTSILLEVSLGATPPPYAHLRLVWDSGHLEGYYQGTKLIDYDSATYFLNTMAGLAGYGTVSGILDWTATAGAALALSVDPNVIGNYGACVPLTLSGTNTSWTPGTPGSPTFTVDHGTISAQTVVSATMATITYCPGDYLGAAVFTDPSTGASVAAVVTSDPTVVPPGGVVLSEAAIAYIERSATAEPSPTIANREMVISESGPAVDLRAGLLSIRLSTVDKTYQEGTDPGVNQLADILWQLVNASQAPAIGPWAHASGVPLSEQLGAAAVLWQDLITVNQYTLGDVITLITGLGVPTIKDVRDDIAGLSLGGDNTAVLEAIAGVKGDPLATVKAVLDLVYILGGSTHNYTLDDVKSWVEAVRGSDLSTIKGVMDKLGRSSSTIEARIDALSDLIVTETTIQGMLNMAIAAVTGGAGFTLSSVEDAVLDAIHGIPASTAVATPLWPGEAGASLGEVLALVDDMTLEGPFDGVLITIATHPPNSRPYAFGAVNSWPHVGAITFYTDRGDHERAESFSLDTQILTPRTMRQAAGCRVRLNAGWSGTIRSWIAS